MVNITQLSLYTYWVCAFLDQVVSLYVILTTQEVSPRSVYLPNIWPLHTQSFVI